MEQSPSWESNSHSASQEIPRLLWNPKVHFRVDKSPLSPSLYFYCEVLLAPRPTSMLEDHPLLALRDCLFNIFAAIFHIW
jgi:hypothetical protein